MEFNQYQEAANETALYPKDIALLYTALGLNGEAGEVAEIIKKMVRSETPLEEVRGKIARELGDVLWYISALAGEIGLTMETIAKANLAKLKNREENETLTGEREDD